MSKKQKITWIEDGRYTYRVINGVVVAIITRTSPSQWHSNFYGRKTFMIDSYLFGEDWSDAFATLRKMQENIEKRVDIDRLLKHIGSKSNLESYGIAS